jgi:hypothetical protein
MIVRPFRVALIVGTLAFAGLAVAQSIQRDSFDGRETAWLKGPANVPVAEEAHILTGQHAHSLPTSEYIRVKAEANGELNPFVYYSYGTKAAPITDDLTLRIWVRANRPNVQLLARAVLPREPNPDKPGEPLTVMLRGEAYTATGAFWQSLDVRKPVKLLKDEQQTLRTKYRHDVNTSDAYIDRLILNLYAGPGVTEVWVDDLELGPVIDSFGAPPPSSGKGPTPAQATSRANVPPPSGVAAVPPPNVGPNGAKPSSRVAVEFNRDQLYVGGRKLIFRGVRYSDTPLKVLRDAGLNTLFVGDKLDSSVYEEAIREGFWLAPTLPAGTPDPEAVTRDVGRFAADDAVLFWYLGGDFRGGEIDTISKTAQAVRSADPHRPIALDAWDGLPAYSRRADLVSSHRFPLNTSLELLQYRDWLNSRRQLDRYGSFFWTWVQTHLQEWFLAAAYPEADQHQFTEPIGPQAEQIRLLTYIALASGCKGLGFWSDRFLADTHEGRDRLLALALLNQEIQMLEPLLLGVVDAPIWIDTSIPEVKAAVLRCERGMLVLPLWLGSGAQCVPGQAATPKLTMTVPMAPVGSQAWVVSPGEVKSLQQPKRVVGGCQIALSEFDITAAIAFTSDSTPNGMLVRWQEQVRKMAPLAAQWTYDLAGVELGKVEKIQSQLREQGHEVSDAQNLLAKAREFLASAKQAWDAKDYQAAYLNSKRALRPLRILMRAEWDAAIKSLGPDAPPTASPFAVSYFTLPKHWRFRNQLESSSPGGNKLADGDFEAGEGLPTGWRIQQATPDEVEGEARLIADAPHGGKRCLMIQLRPRAAPAPAGPDGKPAPPPVITALEPTYLAVSSPPVQLPPGSLVRISTWVKVAAPITASADGALVFDSAGGEPLGIRLTAPTGGWKRFTLFRRVPQTGVLQVTAALTGVGTVFFDDISIEPLNSKQ